MLSHVAAIFIFVTAVDATVVQEISSCQLAIQLTACHSLRLNGRPLPAPCLGLFNIPGNVYRSCKEIHCVDPTAPSGIHSILASNGSIVEVYCDMEGINCGGTGGWTRIALVNMSEPNAICPDGLTLVDSTFTQLPSPVCRADTIGCVSAFFPTYVINYQEVCGQISGYQLGTPEAFARALVITSLTIDDQYLDGVSITHGSSPRTHVWSYPIGVTETRTDRFGCPCNSGSSVRPPAFVGNDYYCESAASAITSGTVFPDDILWDGSQCDVNEIDCCTNSNTPWFKTTLPDSTCDDIELRNCQDESISSEGVLLDFIELYVR